MVTKDQNISKDEPQQLIKGCLSGDRSCQRRIYDLYGSKMMALCLRYSRNREEAEEVLQDGFLRLYKCIKQYKKTGSFEGWLRKIMINCALQRYRGRSNLYRVISLADHHKFLIAKYDFTERLSEKELIGLIQTLPTVYRMVFNLYVFEGMKHKEIALLLDISEGTSKSNLSDARAILKKTLTRNLEMTK